MRLCAAVVVVLSLAAPAVAGPIDPGRWPDGDRRFLQSALVWSGDYVGLTDGDWGARSEAALDAWLDRAARGSVAHSDLQPLLMAMVEEVQASGWGVVNLDQGLTVALPLALLGPVEATDDGVEARTGDDSLVFRVMVEGPRETLEMHRWMIDHDAGPEAPYSSWREDRLVTATTLANGKRVYLRSALIDGAYESMQVIAAPWQRGRLELVASSMQWGAAPDLWPVAGGPIDAVLSAPEAVPAPPPAMAFLAEPDPAPATAPKPRAVPVSSQPSGLRPTGVGTGFFVNNTDLVTAAHVVEGCAGLALEDGSTLSVIAADATLDLAVLTSERRSDAWLAVAGDEGPRLGQHVMALGYPFWGDPIMANQGLSVTGGNVSALPRIADAASRVMISAPIQPGNSGGPMMSGEGAVLGVVVAKADELVILDREGTLPQNMNFAVSTAQLVPFLAASHVLFPAAAGAAPLDLTDGIPDAVQAAVVLVLCLGS